VIIKDVVFAHMDELIEIVSSGRTHRFNWRQVFYRMRQVVAAAGGDELKWKYFDKDLTVEYEEGRGKEPMSYRDPRGTFYMPHGGESIPLGTLQVEAFERPEYRFNKIVFIEKEGFFVVLKAEGWPEKYDCALMTSKGQPTRAARDLIDLIGAGDEPVWVGCLHDCDVAGMIIRRATQGATRIMGGRNVEIIDLGLNPWEAVELARRGLVEIEDVPPRKIPKAVADHVGPRRAEWLRTHRCELNAFATKDLIAWLDAKMAKYVGKLIPPADVLADRLEEEMREILTERITDEILEEADLDGRVEDAMAERAKEIGKAKKGLAKKVKGALESNPRKPWTSPIEVMARELTEEE
jgi:hypothetical protein